MPSRTEPSVGSERMSERLRRSSTRYGPSVCWGVMTQAGKDCRTAPAGAAAPAEPVPAALDGAATLGALFAVFWAAGAPLAGRAQAASSTSGAARAIQVRRAVRREVLWLWFTFGAPQGFRSTVIRRNDHVRQNEH